MCGCCIGGLRNCEHVVAKEQRRERECQLDPGKHQALPQVQAAHREGSGVHAHGVQPVPQRVLLAVPRQLGRPWRAHWWLLLL